MAMTATITKPLAAQVGQPCTFVVTVANGGASQVIIQNIVPKVSKLDGTRLDGCAISQPFANPANFEARIDGQPFNIPVAASGTYTFTFQVCFFGSPVGGGPAAPAMQFLVDCVNAYSDGTVSGCNSALQVAFNQPAQGALLQAAKLDFSQPAMSGLTL